MKSAVNDKIDGLIVYEKGKGYNGYSVNFASLAGKSMTDSIFLIEKHFFIYVISIDKSIVIIIV